MADPKFTFDFGDIPTPPPQEGTVHKLIRWATDPIATSVPGLKDKLEKFAQPGLNDSPTAAKIKGFLAGSAEAVKPGHLAALATLPAMAAEAPAGILGTNVLGLGGTVGNVLKAATGINKLRQVAGAIPAWAEGLNAVGSAAMGIEGAAQTAQDVNDPTKGKLDVAKDVLNTGLGALGSVAGVRNFQKTRNITKALGDIQQAQEASRPTGLRLALDSVRKTGLGTPTTPEEISNQALLYDELKKKPAGNIAQEIFGKDKEVPGDPSHVDLTLAHQAALEDQAARVEDIKDELAKGFSKNLAAKYSNMDKADKERLAAGTQEERNYKAGQRFIKDNLVQDTRNDKAVSSFQQKDAAARAADIKAETKFNVGQAKAAEAAGTQNAKIDDQAIAQADAERQANAIDSLKDRLSNPVEPSVIRETVSGPGEHGGTARATFMRTEPPPPEEEGTVAGAAGGRPINPQAKTPVGPATSKGFQTPEDAQRAADATGGAFSVAQNPNDGLHYLVPQGKQPPWNNGVEQATRPWSQLTAKEKSGVLPLLKQAKDAGVPGDQLESLGDELASKLGMIKAGREAADDSNASLESAVKAIKGSGAPIFDDGSEEIGAFRQFLKKNGISTRGVLAKTGKIRSLDQAAEDLKGTLPGFENSKETSLLDHIQGLAAEEKQSPVDELVSKHTGNWWEKPTAEVQDYTQGDVPALDVEPPSGQKTPPLPTANGPLENLAPLSPRGKAQVIGGVMNPTEDQISRINVNLEREAAQAPISEAAEPQGPADDSFDPAKLEGESQAQSEPPLSVGEFAQALNQEGKKPLVPLPQQTLKLTGEQVPQAPEPGFDFDVKQTANPDGTTTFYPEPKASEEPLTQPEAPQPNAAIPARLFKSQLEAAGPHYAETQAAFKAGEAPNEAARVAGKAASRINRESIAADAAREKAAQIQSVQQEIADPNTDPLTKTMLQRWLGEHGAAQAATALRLGAGTLGGAVGYQQDPLGNRPLSAAVTGGLGFFSPEIASAINKLAPTIGEGTVNRREQIANIAKVINQFHNTALLSPLSVAKKAAGDVGGLTLAAIEHPEFAGDLLKQFTTAEGRANLLNNFKEGFHGPDQEAIGGLDLPNRILNSNKNPMSWSGKMMGGLTKATKGALGEAGFSAPQQRYYTLTDYPRYKSTEYLYNAIRQGDFLKHLVPFARVGVNRLERGYEYSPLGFANLFMKGHSEDPGGTVTKALMGTLAGGAAYAMTPEDFVKNHPITASVASSLAGPVGLPALAGMALKNAHQQKGDPFYARPSGSKFADATQEIARDVPGLRIIEDASGKSPVGFARNYLSGYTNVARPVALGLQYLNEGNMEDPDLTSKNLTPGEQIYNRALSNIPGIRERLPKKEVKITGTPKFDFKF
jgi:hypothetical protein